MDVILRLGAPYVIMMYTKNILVSTHKSIRSLPQLNYHDIPTHVSLLIYVFIYTYINWRLYRDPNLFDEEAKETQVLEEAEKNLEAEKTQPVEVAQETKEVEVAQETKEVEVAQETNEVEVAQETKEVEVVEEAVPVLNVVVKPLEGQGPLMVPVVTQTNCNPCSNRRKV